MNITSEKRDVNLIVKKLGKELKACYIVNGKYNFKTKEIRHNYYTSMEKKMVWQLMRI